MSNKTIVIIIAAIAIALGGYLLTGSKQPAVPSNDLSSDSPSPETLQTQISTQNEVTYSDSGYSPATLRVRVGTTVTFKNKSSHSMWTASAIHPTHRVYGGTSIEEHCPDTSGVAFDQCSVGNEYSFIFTKPGSFGYHDHVNPGYAGTIIVE